MKLATSKRKSNGFGHPKDGAINFGFDELIAHATRTRRLTAGTSIGADTVSNADRNVGRHASQSGARSTWSIRGRSSPPSCNSATRCA
jgi:hypothetical protein